MLLNFLKSTLRALMMDKLNALINLFGLSVGLACSILIYMYVKNELTSDHFHTNLQNIYRVYTLDAVTTDAGEHFHTSTSALLGPEMKSSLPEVSNFVRITEGEGKVFLDGKSISEDIGLFDSTFFDIFSFRVVQGSLRSVFSNPSDLVMSSEMATKYFGENDPIGEQLKIKIANDTRWYTVKAVIEDPPSNSTIRYGLIASYRNVFLFIPEDMGMDWHASFGETYVLMNEGADHKEIPDKMIPVMKTALGDKYKEGKYNVHVQPLEDLHFGKGQNQGYLQTSDIKYVYILTGVALLVLLLASINFTTLSIGRSFVRAKEVGVRKVVGSSRAYIIIQFLGESVIMTFLGFVLAMFIANGVLPWFNQLAGVDIAMHIGWMDALFFVSFGILIGVISGSYPALLISRFQPQNIIKGNFGSKLKKQNLRKSLVIIQYVIAIAFISITLLMFQQMRFLMNKDLGFDKDQLIFVTFESDISQGLKYSAVSAIERGEKIKKEFANIGGVLDVGFATNRFDGNSWIRVGSAEKGKEDDMIRFSSTFVDPGFIPALDIKMLRGRNFSEQNAADFKNAVIVNQALVDEMGWTDPMSEQLPGRYEPHEIIGVTENFIYESMRNEVRPLYLTMNPDFMFEAMSSFSMKSMLESNLYLRLQAGGIQATISKIEQVANRVYPDEPFEFEFVDTSIQAQFEREKNLNKIITTATILAIIVSSLGLFGLSYLTLNARTKEIGIRKAMGASTGSLLTHLLKDYIVILFIAMIIAIPIAYYAVLKWLEEFEFRIKIMPQHFLVAFGIILAMSVLTVSYLVIRASIQKPADALRYE